MSRKKVLDKLKEIHEELAFKNKAYREGTSDVKVHVLVISYGRVLKQAVTQLEKGGAGKAKGEVGGGGNFGPGFKTEHKAMYDALKGLVKTFVRAVIKDFKKLEADSKGKANEKLKYSVEVNETSQFRAEIEVAIPTGGSGTNVFNYIKKRKQTHQKPIVEAIDTYIDENRHRQRSRDGKSSTKDVDKFYNPDRESKSGSSLESQFYFLELGHDETDAVSKQQIRDAKINLDALVASTEGLPDKYNDTFGLAIDVDTKKTPEKLKIYLESNWVNRSQASGEKAEIEGIQADLQKIIDSISAEQWAEFEASDSPRAKREKKVLNALALALPHGKNVRHNIKTEKIKTSKLTESNARKKRATRGNADPFKTAPVVVGKKAASGRKPSGRKARQKSHFNMISMINTKLPRTIKKNMGFPRMENVSGRFAESVKLTDVSQTPKGFPSIGYTYQRDPYQVFETGSRGNWSSPERDPRQLIDFSIREIAAELALGRFYTRRV